jgi:hypothetical protein
VRSDTLDVDAEPDDFEPVDADPADSELVDSEPVVSACATACTGATASPTQIAIAATPYPSGLSLRRSRVRSA